MKTHVALPPVILASASPRRRDLLEEHGIDFEVHPADVCEISPPHLSPGEIVLRNAHAKASQIAPFFPESVVVGVDTIVELDGAILGKPRDFDEASSMLARLNGRSHLVYSGVWLTCPETNQNRGFIEITRVHFHHRTAAERDAYLQRIHPLDKAGAYAAQDDGGEMIREVEGSFTNVVGLPMERLARALERFR